LYPPNANRDFPFPVRYKTAWSHGLPGGRSIYTHKYVSNICFFSLVLW